MIPFNEGKNGLGFLIHTPISDQRGVIFYPSLRFFFNTKGLPIQNELVSMFSNEVFTRKLICKSKFIIFIIMLN